MRTLGRFSSGSALFVFPSTSLLFLLFLHFAGYKLYFQVRFFLIFTDLFHAGQDARQLRQFCNRLTVIGLHSRFISTISDKLKLDILIFVRYNKSDNAAVFPHLVIGLLDCTAQVSGFIAVFRGGSFGKGKRLFRQQGFGGRRLECRNRAWRNDSECTRMLRRRF